MPPGGDLKGPPGGVGFGSIHETASSIRQSVADAKSKVNLDRASAWSGASMSLISTGDVDLAGADALDAGVNARRRRCDMRRHWPGAVSCRWRQSAARRLRHGLDIR